MQEQSLIEKIKSLPPERVAEVEDFVDFLAQRDSRRSVKVSRHDAIAAYAAANAGSEVDLDVVLESAALEHLRDEEGPSR